ncbi:MAG: flagellar biosynthesis protein FlhF [Acidobacteriaceae bacterium]|nr:flagellar biosynthesis protein FlhF [Acidobacteriaceae bacterium]MBV9306364.1 flagellar biosynthesis protein FlhF [Acidobacteriaceae bacterium]MBV9680129.1 flagellar biosynthesis protein FlhF [Acidobacteriaceae bacterium]MBV9939056.1 flagellar biosynthesis protein FlhF [Acidobacteriaceae bacterium]
MRLKSYFAASVQEAIENARLELGPDAMLLNSRKIVPEQSHLGAYEVVFGITDEPLLRKPATPLPDGAESSAKKSVSLAAPEVEITAPKGRPATLATEPVPLQSNAIAEELAELRKQIAGVKDSLSSAAQNGGRYGGPRQSLEAIGVYAQLAAFSISEDLANDLVAAAETRKASSSESTSDEADGQNLSSLQRALMAELDERVTVKPEIGRAGEERQIVMFVGPPGAGKTTTIAKLAARLGLQKRIPVHLLSLDTLRVGGSEQLATFARILGFGFDALYTTASLSQALEGYSTKKLILIDSPGYAPAEIEEAAQTARFLQHHPEVEVQLVLPAYLSASNLKKFTQRFSVFNPEKLLFTHLDEVETTGPAVEHAIRSALPVSFLTDGQGVPQDLHDATKSRLTDGLFNVRAARTAA